MNELLEEVLALAKQLGTRDNRGGMASVKVQWYPYQAEWTASVDWSSGRFEQVSDETPEGAINSLSQIISSQIGATL